MTSRLRRATAIAARGIAVVSLPLAGLAAPAVSWADEVCPAGLYWDIYTEQCIYYDYTVYVDPSPIVGPNPIVGPVGPVGVGGVVGPVGPGPVGPGPIGPRRR